MCKFVPSTISRGCYWRQMSSNNTDDVSTCILYYLHLFYFLSSRLARRFWFRLGCCHFLALGSSRSTLGRRILLVSWRLFRLRQLILLLLCSLLRFASSWAFFCFCDKVLNAVFHSETDKDLPLQLVHGFLPHIEQPSHAAYSGEALLYFRTLPRFDQQNIKLPSASGFALISTLAWIGFRVITMCSKNRTSFCYRHSLEPCDKIHSKDRIHDSSFCCFVVFCSATADADACAGWIRAWPTACFWCMLYALQ